MFNNEEIEEDRSHQDNFWSEGSYNNEWQYCKMCGTDRRFEYDRCSVCHNN